MSEIKTLLTSAQEIILNILEDPDLQAGVARFGFDEEEIAHGQGLTDNLARLIQEQEDRMADRHSAGVMAKQARKVAEQQFSDHVQLARRAFRNDPQATADIDLSVQDEDAFVDWLTRARQFYRKLLSNEAYLAAMAGEGQTREMIEASLNLVEAAETQRKAHRRAETAKQRATKARDAAGRVLTRWLSDLRRAGTMAFRTKEEEPLLEKLGIRTR